MARIPESEIEQLKSEVSVERLVESAGITLKKSGRDLHRLLPVPRGRHRQPDRDAGEEPLALLRLRRCRRADRLGDA